MGKKLPKIINKEEFEKIFAAMSKSKYKLKKQVMLAMLLGFEAGMRISEIVGLKGRYPKLQKFQVESNLIRITGKGKRIELFLNQKE